MAKSIDTSFAHAARLLLPAMDKTAVYLIGCGGTGSWLAPAVARLVYVMREQRPDISIVFIDPDTVEAGNIPRQNFCAAEIGRPKALTLAQRYGAAWGMEIAARVERFDPKIISGTWDRLSIIIGCVDNAAARRAIAATLKKNKGAHSVWWLDCGNANESGQVLLGSSATVADLKDAFVSKRVCGRLPGPHLQAPDLLKARHEERNGHKLSCAELMAANAQSLTINQAVAAVAADYLARMLGGGPLVKFATYIDQATGSARSRAITEEEITAVVKPSRGKQP
ncbi:MAG: PRTRC system ThiF family protein [Blastocatellia bacterium]|nr:PRTRC system ThiF family protein [Blastocatellia bacterium]